MWTTDEQRTDEERQRIEKLYEDACDKIRRGKGTNKKGYEESRFLPQECRDFLNARYGKVTLDVVLHGPWCTLDGLMATHTWPYGDAELCKNCINQ